MRAKLITEVDMSEKICVKTHNSRHEAELSKGILESNGIRAFVAADDCSGQRPHPATSAGGARLIVDETKAEEAFQLFEAFDNGR